MTHGDADSVKTAWYCRQPLSISAHVNVGQTRRGSRPRVRNAVAASLGGVAPQPQDSIAAPVAGAVSLLSVRLGGLFND